MLDALLATIGTLGVLASLLAKRGKAGTRADADADTELRTAFVKTLSAGLLEKGNEALRNGSPSRDAKQKGGTDRK